MPVFQWVGDRLGQSETFSGGRGGIRTHERVAPLPVFKTGALNHSATLPLSKINHLVIYQLPPDSNLAPNNLPFVLNPYREPKPTP
jgi:hypothetical protein